MNIDDLLLLMGIAAQGLGRIVARLDERVNHTTGDEQRAILLQLPTLRADWRDLESDIQALSAQRAALKPPSGRVMDDLVDATNDLSARIAQDQSTSALLGMATKVSAAAGKVRQACT